MKDLRHLIARHEGDYTKLHAQVHETFQRREASDLAWRDWELAAKRFRDYRSEVDDLLDRCLSEGLASDVELRSFAFCFVAQDPYYFRSGYALEGLLRKIKKLSLTDAEKAILRALILKRIDTRALRNFRQICRFIPLIDTPEFSNDVAARTHARDASVRHRAAFALSFFPS